MLEEIKQLVYEANMSLPRYGLVAFTWGNASAIDREKGLVVIKPGGMEYAKLKPEDMVVMDLEGRKVDGYFIFSDLAMIDSKVVESEEIENEYGQEE